MDTFYDPISGNTFQDRGSSIYGKFCLYCNCRFAASFIANGTLDSCISQMKGQKRKKEKRKEGRTKKRKKRREGGIEGGDHLPIWIPSL